MPGDVRRRRRRSTCSPRRSRTWSTSAAPAATTPSTCRSRRGFFPTVVRAARAHRPVRRPAPTRWRRVVIEKPFGHDLKSAHELNDIVEQRLPARRGLPDRPLPGQGDGPEHPGAALRQPAVRADLERQLRRPRADHHGRGHRHRRPGRLLRRHRRRPRRHPEPPAAAARADRDGGAGLLRRQGPARGEGEGALRGPAAARTSAKATARGQYAAGWQGGEKVVGYLEEDGIAPDSTHRDLRRDQAGDRHPPLGGRAVLPAHRQAARPAGHRDRRGLQAGAAPAVRRRPPPRSSARTPWSSGCSRTRASRMRFGSKVPGTAMEVRDVTMDFAYGESFTESSPEAYERLHPRRAARRPAAVPAARGGRAVLEDPRPDRGVLGQARASPSSTRPARWGPPAADEMMARDGRELEAAVIIDLPEHHDQRRINTQAGRAARRRGGAIALGRGADPGHRHRRERRRRRHRGRQRGEPRAPLPDHRRRQRQQARRRAGWTPRSGSAATPAPARSSCCGCTASSPTTPTAWSSRCCCRTPRSWPGGRPRRPDDPAEDPIGALAQRRITDAGRGRATRARRCSAGPATYAPGDTDLAWTRITPWRRLLAAALDQPPYEPVDARHRDRCRRTPRRPTCWPPGWPRRCAARSPGPARAPAPAWSASGSSAAAGRSTWSGPDGVDRDAERSPASRTAGSRCRGGRSRSASPRSCAGWTPTRSTPSP